MGQNLKNDLLIEDLQQAAIDFKDEHPTEIIRWGIDRLGASAFTLACSFGYEDVALVDMLLKVDPDVDIFYLDTDLHFSETYEIRDRLHEYFQKEFTRVSPVLSLKQQATEHGEKLWEKSPDICCRIRKVEPLRNYLQGFEGWITGIRREQSPTRANTEVIEYDQTFGLVKINPLAFWDTKQVWNYIYEHQIPYNPLHDQNYPSIGCFPCTRPVRPGEDPRAGRWAGTQKIECGLHNTPLESK
ncbi:phosphoadenylyl-sulfate reductase [Thermoflavimicrobium daqui]|jgi:phosphoadenosine phosphosulfate reductase|uniref:Adenosine 5'-phosphosulfate reductase n=1 Tax=Thermoflavimicrobium daqui TaxID=2137476 RepID=A0A364K4Y2_9BACL|nr:phosphoadenylyl-sulfate reductase [Thermoflavimicrobium daqui]RAL24434.1 phosphoadenylyl-sulfate reductase [Thermoflavimicrobium daqui]